MFDFSDPTKTLPWSDLGSLIGRPRLSKRAAKALPESSIVSPKRAFGDLLENLSRPLGDTSLYGVPAQGNRADVLQSNSAKQGGSDLDSRVDLILSYPVQCQAGATCSSSRLRLAQAGHIYCVHN